MFIVEQENNKPAKKEIIRSENEKTSKADACKKKPVDYFDLFYAKK